jgi:hypothetical protein
MLQITALNQDIVTGYTYTYGEIFLFKTRKYYIWNLLYNHKI